ncbi:hypothetical protein [Mesorhizobium sp.]|uniref:hypothetical protein n=1 Tax=Mesorhizobium sp. TaxID=1871066 RepID=UPI00120F5C7D|nr:hypothetical protein [Mesorhizobium sp.]TIS60101.1 MAG: hypothetical protein E5W91_00640 [Mesorhizobium sp.]TIS89498.1 MAG: hypothetical protein E5W89_15700 [Mesorhizobium sp.]
MLEIERATAVEFDERVNLALKHLFAAATELKGSIDPEHFQTFARALAHACRELDMGVLEPIYHVHPDFEAGASAPNNHDAGVREGRLIDR